MTTTRTFYKLQGAGNDFVVFDARNGDVTLERLIAAAPRICDRRFGIGADGVMALFPPRHDEHYEMIYRNADGSYAGMCGNGGRCIARLATYLGVSATHRFSVHGHTYTAQVEPSQVDIQLPAEPQISIITDDHFDKIFDVNTGTEHIVIECDENFLNDSDNLRKIGRSMRFDERFAPKGTNVNFFSNYADSGRIRLVTYERGVEDLTLACGTGALAAAIVHAQINDPVNSVNQRIIVENNGGNLTTSFNLRDGKATNLHLIGPAEIVFKGEFSV
ncbi:MAG: diaminopimelate epimerase [Balneolales bacterium]|nr:diaminopimelate epimerase [Balneolales bacterium]